MQKFIKDILMELSREGILVSYKNLNIKEAIHGISYNSTMDCENKIFVCKGFNFNRLYLKDAIKKGAVIYVSEKVHFEDFPYIIVSDERKALAVLSKIFYGKEVEKLKKIGVTGTKGKSTTSFFIKNVLDTYLLGKSDIPCGIISSIKTFDGSITRDAVLTTPESLEVYKTLSNASSLGMEYFVCEVSSIAYKYNRVYGINFDVGVFLNIGYDHISDIEHKNFDDYFSSKLKLIENSEYIVINEELMSFDKVQNALKNKDKNKIITYGKSSKADYQIISSNSNNMGNAFKVKYGGKIYDYSIKLKGGYNIENAVACIAVCDTLGIEYKYIYKGILNVKVKGRGEIYKTKDGKKIIVVDYAHNGLSLSKYFEFIHEEYPGRKHICVIGSTGDKAINRRKDIGQICEMNCDELILTTDDSSNEDFNDICLDILKYVEDKSKVKIIEDRTMAIEEAIKDSLDDNVVISILGKGAENTQKIKGKKLFYISDSINAKKFVDKYNEEIS